MAKRFIETEFFKNPFVRSLDAPHKMLYAFIICDCDNCGIWNPEFEITSIYIGLKVERKSVEQVFNGKYIQLENGKWFFPDFIQHQYPKGLQEKNPAHFKIIEILSKLDFLDENKQLKGSFKGLVSTLKGTKVMVKDKVEGMVMVKVKEKGKEKQLFVNSEFYDFNKFDLELRSDEKYIPFDTRFYYESVKNWSSEGNSKKDWIATVKSWMLRDLKEGKPKLKQQYQKKFNNGKQSNKPTTPEEQLHAVLELSRNKYADSNSHEGKHDPPEQLSATNK